MEQHKTPLLCLHGALGSGNQLRKALEALEDQYELFCPDLPGHGALCNQGLSPETLVIFVADYIKSNNLQGAAVLGYSMGGYTALSVALKNPELPGRIITLGTRFNWTPEFAAGEKRKLNPAVMQEKIPGYVAQLQQMHGDQWAKTVFAVAEMMEDLGNRPRLTDFTLQQIAQDVAVCRASGDQMVEQAESERAAHMLQNGRYVQIPDSFHPVEKTNIQVLRQLANL